MRKKKSKEQSQPSMTLRQKMQMAQHEGINSRCGMQITLPQAPWETEQWESSQSQQSE